MSSSIKDMHYYSTALSTCVHEIEGKDLDKKADQKAVIHSFRNFIHKTAEKEKTIPAVLDILLAKTKDSDPHDFDALKKIQEDLKILKKFMDAKVLYKVEKGPKSWLDKIFKFFNKGVISQENKSLDLSKMFQHNLSIQRLATTLSIKEKAFEREFLVEENTNLIALLKEFAPHIGREAEKVLKELLEEKDNDQTRRMLHDLRERTKEMLEERLPDIVEVLLNVAHGKIKMFDYLKHLKANVALLRSLIQNHSLDTEKKEIALKALKAINRQFDKQLNDTQRIARTKIRNIYTLFKQTSLKKEMDKVIKEGANPSKTYAKMQKIYYAGFLRAFEPRKNEDFPLRNNKEFIDKIAHFERKFAEEKDPMRKLALFDHLVKEGEKCS